MDVDRGEPGDHAVVDVDCGPNSTPTPSATGLRHGIRGGASIRSMTSSVGKPEPDRQRPDPGKHRQPERTAPVAAVSGERHDKAAARVPPRTRPIAYAPVPTPVGPASCEDDQREDRTGQAHPDPDPEGQREHASGSGTAAATTRTR